MKKIKLTVEIHLSEGVDYNDFGETIAAAIADRADDLLEGSGIEAEILVASYIDIEHLP